MSLSAHEIILHPVISEKSMDESQRGKYTFAVRDDVSKIQIEAAIEEIFKVKVAAVNPVAQGHRDSGPRPEDRVLRGRLRCRCVATNQPRLAAGS